MKLSDEASGNWLVRAIGCAGAIVICLYFVGAWFGRALGPMAAAGRSKMCQDNLRVLVRAEKMYADDYEDRLPPATQWVDRIAGRQRIRLCIEWRRRRQDARKG